MADRHLSGYLPLEGLVNLIVKHAERYPGIPARGEFREFSSEIDRLDEYCVVC